MGEFYALLTPAIWGLAVMFLRRSGETVSPLALNLFRVAITTPLLILTVLALREPLLPDVPVTDYVILLLSGVIAIAISDTMFHLSLNLVGAGLSAIVGCLYSPMMILLAFVLLGERLGAWQFVGMGLVLAGVLIAARHKPSRDATPRQIAVGMIWGAASLAVLAFGIVIAKPVLNRSPVVWATTVRQVGSLVVLLPVCLILPTRRRIFGALKPSRYWKYTLTGTILGSYFALMAWIAGMKYTMVGIAAILNQTSTIFILLFATLFLKEPFTRRKLVASAIAFAGIVVVTYTSIT